uniref:Uncharacterized protein n=2 Tax=Odontella aurita TaxID=265563 RepID=A0A7S4ITR2_9STRA|mmetsp:Transcript_30092/g.89457  ORF Transcript_30092/g.89457 Transcript_30092/m.89457 type:complete len:1836 (+) Transcript_30092:701-6208(+)
MYNPAPGGRSLLEGVFTKIVTVPRNNDSEGMGGVPLQDEIKVRLPDILDGSHSLQFSLFGVNFSARDSGGLESNLSSQQKVASPALSCDLVAEALVPLSSSATREPCTGSRVATVIPDGMHRIGLGSHLRLQVESRLVSSVHVSDPAVAAALRDFPPPLAEAADGTADLGGAAELAIPHSRSGVGGSSSSSPRDAAAGGWTAMLVPMHNILSSASGRAVAYHLHSLVYLHLRNLVSAGAPAIDFSFATHLMDARKASGFAERAMVPASKDLRWLTETVRCLLMVLRQARLHFAGGAPGDDEGGRGRSRGPGQRLWRDRFLKRLLDWFDEGTFLQRRSALGHQDDILVRQTSNAESMVSDADAASRGAGMVASSSSQSLTGIEKARSHDNAAPMDGARKGYGDGNIRVVIEQNHRPVARARFDVRGLSPRRSSKPFSRKAYGASRTDQMRVEAEMYESSANSRFTEFFDDELTVVTMDLSLATGATTEFSSGAIGRKLLDHQTPDTAASAASAAAARMSEGMRQWGLTVDEEDEGGSNYGEEASTASGSPCSPSMEKVKSTASSTTTPFKSMAKRVNTVAQLMLTPCVAPNLSSVLASSTSGGEYSPSAAKGGRKAAARGSGKVGGSIPTQDKVPSVVTGTASGPNRLSKTEARQQQQQQQVCCPGSDVDNDDDEVESFAPRDNWAFLGAPPRAKLRGSHYAHVERLEFSFPSLEEGRALSSEYAQLRTQPFLYEVFFSVWLHIWLDHTALSASANELETANLFVTNMDFLLPVCLRSIAMRCSLQSPNGELTTTVFDGKHIQVMIPLIQVLTRGLFNKAFAFGENDDQDLSDTELVLALSLSDSFLDFLCGLLSLVHPAQTSLLVETYLKTLRGCEVDDGDRMSDIETSSVSSSVAWTHASLRRVRCSRQLRLRAVEKLACVPQFVALNYPWKYSPVRWNRAANASSWAHQTYDDVVSERKKSMSQDMSDRLPSPHWLAEMLANECFVICSTSCEAVVAEAVAQIKASHQTQGKKSQSQRKGLVLTRKDLLRFQSTAVHAITCVYELLLRRHATDGRYQVDESRRRVAAMLLSPVLDHSVINAQWLAKMEATHKVRSLWLMCVLHVLQEAPEVLLREKLRNFCMSPDFHIHRFVRVLRLCSSTYQSFLLDNTSHSAILGNLSPWLLQESFNTICAATNILVDECHGMLNASRHEQTKMAQGILDLLLHIISAPHSCVTHLRALGGASQALDHFGPAVFLDVVGDTLQHWARMLLTLMNSTSLSVRSIAVDFMVSLLGETFKEVGNVDEIAMVLVTVMPEVVAREIALYSVSGQVLRMEDIECSIWPLRRALADVEDTNPADDNRVDSHLSPVLTTLCRTCQAVIDGVLVELRLKGSNSSLVGSSVQLNVKGYTFDADEESLFEAANFFQPETGPLQRIRWLLTLKSLHESKGQWVEAAEALLLCSKTIADAVPYIKRCWRPSQFDLWQDERRSIWLSTVGEEIGLPDRSNAQVVDFAGDFLEPAFLFGIEGRRNKSGMLNRPTVASMSRMLATCTKEAVSKYLMEDGMESLAFKRLEELLKVVMDFIEDHSTMGTTRMTNHGVFVEENVALRKMTASLNADMTRLAERMVLLSEGNEPEADDTSNRQATAQRQGTAAKEGEERIRGQFYVRVVLLGRKPDRFKESTALPTFLEWETPSVCRVPQDAIAKATTSKGNEEQSICSAFAEPLLAALSTEVPYESISVLDEIPSESSLNLKRETRTFLVVTMVRMQVSSISSRRVFDFSAGAPNSGESKHFIYKKKDAFRQQQAEPGLLSSGQLSALSSRFVELTVAHQFPCALSRQRTLITSELLTGK